MASGSSQDTWGLHGGGQGALGVRGCLHGEWGPPRATASDKALENTGQGWLRAYEPGPGSSGGGSGPCGRGELFSLFPPLGKRGGKADPKVAGVGTLLQKGSRPLGQTGGSQKRGGQKEDIYDTEAWRGVSQPHRAPVVQIQRTWV